MKENPLTPEERAIIEDKRTEPPFSGEYDDFFNEGVYLCRRCDKSLYRSDSKFDSGCGWPSFDDEIKGAVTRVEDGERTEMVCSECGAHLGHLFTGEGLTSKNVRHCINSLSLRFVPARIKKGEADEVVLGGGCFWCLDAAYRMMIGVKEVVAGYAGGTKIDPSYEEVLSGTTGHAEVVKVTYDHDKIGTREVLEVFFTIHDPTTPGRQGADVGEQYRSVIFYRTWEQKEAAEMMVRDLADSFSDPIVTEIRPLTVFYRAEDEHQDYYSKNPDKPYCRAVIAPKVTDMSSKFKRIMRR